MIIPLYSMCSVVTYLPLLGGSSELEDVNSLGTAGGG